MICTIRIPDVLQARIDHAAGEEGRSKWILEACRMRLDGDIEMPSDTSAASLSDVMSGASDTSFGIAPRQDLLAKLRVSVAAIESKIPESISDVPIVETPLCHKTWWEDGEQYECLMDKGHKSFKCGQHGNVRNITP